MMQAERGDFSVAISNGMKQDTQKPHFQPAQAALHLDVDGLQKGGSNAHPCCHLLAGHVGPAVGP